MDTATAVKKPTHLVVREHAGHPIYYAGMDHSRDHVHTARWQDTRTYAWAFASRGDAAIVAKKHGGKVIVVAVPTTNRGEARSPFSPEEIARQLDETRTGATLPVGLLGDWLLKQRLVRKSPRTGWFDITSAGRRELERLRSLEVR